MKKLLTIAATAALIFTGCGKGSGDSDTMTTSDSLQIALANQDSLLVLMNDISDGLTQIKQMENILANPSLGESTSTREQMKNDLIAINATLRERRQRLDELEKKLSNANATNATLQKTIKSLKAQIAENERSIATLQRQLGEAQERIVVLTGENEALQGEVQNVSAQRDDAQRQNADLTTKLNNCYYAIGTKKELKDNGLISEGWNNNLLTENFASSNYFKRVDKTQLNQIATHARKVTIRTKQPKSSYSIVDEGGQKVIMISNPDAFWGASKYLVIQVD